MENLNEMAININADIIAQILAYVGLGLMLGLAGSGSALGTSIAGSASIGSLKKTESGFGSFLLLSAMPGTQGLYGFASFFLFLQKLQEVGSDLTIFQGAAMLGVGVGLGLACIISGIKQGQVCANGISAIGSGHKVFANTLILAVFPELYAIISFAGAFLVFVAL